MNLFAYSYRTLILVTEVVLRSEELVELASSFDKLEKLALVFVDVMSTLNL